MQGHAHAGFLKHLAKNLFADLMLVKPRDILSKAADIVLAANAPVKLERIAANHFLFAEIGAGQAAGRHAAQMGARLEQRDLEASRAPLTAVMTPPAVPP